MKFEVRMEQGRAVILFPNEEFTRGAKDVTIYSEIGEHAGASRAYVRSMKKPSTEAEQQKAYSLLRRYFSSLPGHFYA